MLTLAIPCSPLTSPPSPPLLSSPTLWRCSSSPSRFDFSTTSCTTLAPPCRLPQPPSPAWAPLARSPSPSPPPASTGSDSSDSQFSLDCSSPTLSPCQLSSCPPSPLSLSSAFSSRRLSRHIRHLPPMAQHHFYHWLHIRSLYESQFTHYVAAGWLLPLDIHSNTVTSSRPLTFDSYRVHLTTSTTTVMPHATATTSTSTSYRQLTSDVLCLPPSPPLLALAGFVPPAPFSYEFTYPSHPFSYPPAAVLEALPSALLSEDCCGSREAEEEAEEAIDADEEEGEVVEEECDEEAAAEQSDELELLCGWTNDSQAERSEQRECLEEDVAEQQDDTANDSDDEWSVGDDVTELDARSSYAPSYAPSYAGSDAEAEEDEDEVAEVKKEPKLRVQAAAGAAAAGEMRKHQQKLSPFGVSF